MQVKPNGYTSLVAQPIDIRFSFTTGLIAEWNPDGTRNEFDDQQEGVVQVVILLGTKEYGPYQTIYRTTYYDWSWRNSLRPSLASKLVQSRVQALTKRLLSAWSRFAQNGPEITIDMLLERAGLVKVSSAQGGAKYVI